ncbi:MAG: lysophospholipid acyltransferase family protein [Kiritimatiellia bacterium]|jgi:1-acyl-sn-glycerol-3-phosphate acyltransferase
MKTSPLDEFHLVLASKDGYASPGQARPPRRPRGAWVSLRFHLGGTVRTSILGGKEAILRRLTPRRVAEISLGMLRALERQGVRFRIEGFDRLANAPGPRVYVANHMSLVETMILPSVLLAFGDLSVVAKKSLAKYPFFGQAMKGVGAILVSRENPKRDLHDVLEQGTAFLKEGRSVLLFPQAKRAIVFQPKEFNSLGVKLARKAGVLLTPIALRTDVAPPGKTALLRDFGPVDLSNEVRFRCGPDLDPASASPGEVLDAARDFISSTLSGWGLPVGE